MQFEKILIQTEDVFWVEGLLLSHDAVMGVNIATAVQLQVKFRPSQATLRELAGLVNGSIIEGLIREIESSKSPKYFQRIIVQIKYERLESTF